MSFKKFDGSTWQPITPKKLKGIPYTGTLPATLTGTKAGYLHRYKIYGNTEQTGTPTPENPVMPSGCGERTENLFDLFSYYEVSAPISDIIIEKNSITYNAQAQYLAIKYKFNLGIADVYTISLGGDSLNTVLELRYAKNGEYIGKTIITKPNQKAIIRGGNEYDGFYIFISNGTNTGTCTASNIMLNLGSTALPYEPYGCKLPLTSGSTPVDIYIGDDTISAEEYVDSGTGKVYRMVSGTLTPVDPPVPFPNIPTSVNSTTISWAGEGLAPSEFDSIQEWVDIPTYTRVNGVWVADN